MKKGFKIAKEISKKATYRIRMGCCFVKGGKVVSKGYNQKKAKRVADGYWSTHAEIAALSRCKHPEGADVYVFRMLKRTGMPALAKPCEICEQVLKNAGVKRIFYTTDEPPFFKRL